MLSEKITNYLKHLGSAYLEHRGLLPDYRDTEQYHYARYMEALRLREAQTAEVRKQEYLRAYQQNEALRQLKENLTRVQEATAWYQGRAVTEAPAALPTKVEKDPEHADCDCLWCEGGAEGHAPTPAPPAPAAVLGPPLPPGLPNQAGGLPPGFFAGIPDWLTATGTNIQGGEVKTFFGYETLDTTPQENMFYKQETLTNGTTNS